MTDIDHLKKKAEELSAGNNRSYVELQQHLGRPIPMDTGDARRETFIDCLEEWGIISPEQRQEFEIKFHEKVEEALNGMWAEVREAQSKAKLSVVKKPSTLLGPTGQPIKGN